jgi:hypothetical protein
VPARPDLQRFVPEYRRVFVETPVPLDAILTAGNFSTVADFAIV